MRKRMPGDFEHSTKYFGWLTWKELLRLGLPGAVLALISSTAEVEIMLGAVFTGFLLGVLWFSVRPHGQPLEVHLYHRLRWIVSGGDH